MPDKKPIAPPPVKVGDVVELTVESLAFGGDAVAKVSEFTLFVEGGVPGERAVAEIIEVHRSFGRARLISPLEPGSARVLARCPVASECGGCSWQHLLYSAQAKAKEGFVREALRRIGRVENPPLRAMRAALNPWAYRNKAIVPVEREGEAFRFGFYVAATHEICPLPVQGCAIQSPATDQLLRAVSALLASPGSVTAFKGLRHVAVRSNTQGETLLAFVSAAPLNDSVKPLLERLCKSLPSLKGIVNNLQPEPGNTIFGTETRTLWGADHLVERLGDFRFRMSALSFFQVNPEQTLSLWDLLRECRTWTGQERILELYCGVGTLSMPLRRWASSLTGYESFAPAVEDAKSNAILNELSQMDFHIADALEGASRDRRADLIVVDPPRKGMEDAVIQALAQHPARELLYVSCDPASLARDTARLAGAAWRLEAAWPLDMFPQTYHVETLARYTR